jgi:hypothetical protein
MKMRAVADSEQIELLRGGSVVSSFAGAFGSALRETRLTTMLGYLIALEPQIFCNLFGFRGTPRSVRLETRYESDRSDILVETTSGRGVIEAKVTATDPFRQAQHNPAKWRVLLTEHVPSGEQRRLRDLKYFRWRDLAGPLEELKKSTNSQTRFVSQNLIKYLGEHAMGKTNEPVEIYAREINDEETLVLFLQAQLYGCHYEQSSRVAEALYFTPHFGQRIARKHPGTKVGISYIATIEQVEVGETWKDLLQITREIRGKQWLNGHEHLQEPLHRDWNWPRKRSFLFLSKPRRVFNPPVLKGSLQKGKGWLSRRTFSFDELFKAWGC